MSGFDVIEGGAPGRPPGHRRQKNPGLKKVKRTLMQNPGICYC